MDKFNLKKELECLETEHSTAPGNMTHSNLESDVSEIIANFQSYNEIIKDMVNQALISINHYVNNGLTDQEILDEFNKHFEDGNKFKSTRELYDYLINLGI